MNYLPTSVKEVKSIVVALNLKTNTVFKYMKCARGVCLLPQENGQFDFEDGLGEEMDMVCAFPPWVEPGAAGYEGDATLYYERPVKLGEVTELGLGWARAMAAARANPRQEPVREEPPEKRQRNNVVKITDVKKLSAGFRSVGRELKLAWLPVEIYEEKSFSKLKLGEQELYRICRTYAKHAVKETKPAYVEIGIAQAAGLLERRKKDMLASSSAVNRKAALKIRTNTYAVRRYFKTLKKNYWLECFVRGRPRKGSPYVSRYVVAMSEKQRFKMLMMWKKTQKKKKSPGLA